MSHDVNQPWNAIEEVHGGVLPVHQVIPVLFLIVIQLQMRSIRNKLLGYHSCVWNEKYNYLSWCLSYRLMISLYTNNRGNNISPRSITPVNLGFSLVAWGLLCLIAVFCSLLPSSAIHSKVFNMLSKFKWKCTGASKLLILYKFSRK